MKWSFLAPPKMARLTELLILWDLFSFAEQQATTRHASSSAEAVIDGKTKRNFHSLGNAFLWRNEIIILVVFVLKVSNDLPRVLNFRKTWKVLITFILKRKISRLRVFISTTEIKKI